MAYIGTRAHARAATALMDDTKEWRSVGTGSYRNAWLHIPTNVVYKVGCSGAWGDAQYESPAEVRNAQRLWRQMNGAFPSAHVRIPRVSGYTVDDELVVAMEYVKGHMLTWGDLSEPGHLPETTRRGLWELYRIGFADMHNSNFLIDEDGYVVPIDLASPCRKGCGDTRTLPEGPEKVRERERRGFYIG